MELRGNKDYFFSEGGDFGRGLGCGLGLEGGTTPSLLSGPIDCLFVSFSISIFSLPLIISVLIFFVGFVFFSVEAVALSWVLQKVQSHWLLYSDCLCS